ncbi:MAG: hypothetical protein J0H09_26645 [Burkholderiales bacterium]|nr:hypothetical protein [Burkholderiales bacterium]
MNESTKVQARHPYVPEGLLGLMVPYGNFAVEWEMSILMGYPNFALTTRLMSDEGADLTGRLRSYFDPARLSDAMRSFGSTPLGCVGVACSSTSYFIGREREQKIFATLEREFGTRFVWSTEAVRQALTSLGSRSMCLVSPYPHEITKRCAEYWVSLGFEVDEVIQIDSFSGGFHPIYTLTPAIVQTHLEAAVRRSRSPVVITGTGLSTLPAVIRVLRAQDRNGPPVLSANLCLAWSMLAVAADERFRAENWFTADASWLEAAIKHPRMQEFVDA